MQEFFDSMGLEASSFAIGALIGLILSAIYFIGKILRLSRENARLENMGQTFDS